MKNIITLLIVTVSVILIASCASNNNIRQTTGKVDVLSDTLRIANDSLEYELIVIEPGFNSWLATQPPRGFYAQSTMEIDNNFKVREYNLRVQNPISYKASLYQWRIDYDPRVDYGYEVNYLLYNYFLFFEQRYNQRLR